MSNVRVPDFKVGVVVEGEEVARFEFFETSRTPAAWEVQAAIISRDAREAVRSCLLACVAELRDGTWEAYTFEAESAGETNGQPQLPWE